MTDKQKHDELAAIKKLAEGHKQMIESMLQNNSALLTIIDVYQALERHREITRHERPKLTVLK